MTVTEAGDAGYRGDMTGSRKQVEPHWSIKIYTGSLGKEYFCINI